MYEDDYYDLLLEEAEDLPHDPNIHGAFAGGPPILTEAEARNLLNDPESFERRAQDALRRARERAAQAEH